MHRYIFLLSSFCLLFLACTDQGSEETIAELQASLDEAQSQISAVEDPQAGSLVHLVFLTTREDLTDEERTTLLSELGRLGEIEEVKGYDIGEFEDLEDARALSQYNLILSMYFESEDDYRVYQNNDDHLDVRSKLGAYLAGPPATYDYIVQ